MPKSTILVIEDDRSLASSLEYNLSNNGYQVFCAYDGQEGVEQAVERIPDLILLDVMLPGLDGLAVCRQLREGVETRFIPILMLTAKTDESDQLAGFSAGADDYVTKPFNVEILLERTKSLIRRKNMAGALGSSDVVSFGGLTIDRVKHRVSAGDKGLDLTPSEFRLLDTMIRQPGKTFNRNELIDAALGADATVLTRTVDVHIRSLRKKLRPSRCVIVTVRGTGYRLTDSQSEPPP